MKWKEVNMSSSVATALPKPRVKLPRKVIDLGGFMRGKASEMEAEIRVFKGLDRVAQLRYVKAAYQLFADERVLFGLGGGKYKLLTVDDPTSVKRASNLKLGKNSFRTLGWTGQAATKCKVLVDGVLVVLNTCTSAGLCQAMCVLQHGKGTIPLVEKARNWRTWLVYKYPEIMAAVLWFEIDANTRGTSCTSDLVLLRMNVDSDLPWEVVPSLFDHEGLMAYDYTKHESILSTPTGWVLPNYRKVYSVNEKSPDREVWEFLKRGGSVAVVGRYAKGTQPPAWTNLNGFWWPVEDGDLSDDRFATPAGHVVALRAKGKAIGKNTAFTRVL